MAAIDRGDKDYLRLNCSTTKNTVNKLFANNTRDSFATVEKNAAGKKRMVSATTLARAIYRFATAPTEEAAIAHHAVIEVFKECGVKVSDQKDDFLRFMAVDAWQMARKTPEVPNDPSCHSPLKRHLLLARAARLFLKAEPTWLVDKASIIETLKTFIVFRKAEFYVTLLEDTKRMALRDSADALALREYAEKVAASSRWTRCARRFSPRPRPRPRPEPLA